MNPLDLISFDDANFDRQGDRDGVRVWHTDAGDGLGLYYFPIPPDIDADLEDVDAVRACYRRGASESGMAIIEIDTPIIQERRCVHAILKVPQQPTGMSYLGSLTLPFRDFSYVLKVGCVERGLTGVREAVVFNQLLKDAAISVSRERRIEGWMADPYDTEVHTPLMRNMAEAKEYDGKFPEHPLTRARRVLDRVQATITIAPDLRNASSFEYVKARRQTKPWWRPW
jgi:hypothetical protein